MFFLMNDVVLSVDLQQMTPPLIANRFSALSLECVLGLGREIFAEEPQLQRQRLERAKRSADRKGWRWIGEMEEIAAALAAQGLPDGFHRAAADVFRNRSQEWQPGAPS